MLIADWLIVDWFDCRVSNRFAEGDGSAEPSEGGSESFEGEQSPNPPIVNQKSKMHQLFNSVRNPQSAIGNVQFVLLGGRAAGSSAAKYE
ncbi:MAG TPA: hypothetical protein VD833_00515 [Vicinamibacterales bacterium]|nr:hypothetical protein [Vicinamibacterales bacterium]